MINLPLIFPFFILSALKFIRNHPIFQEIIKMQNYEKYKLSYCKNTGKDTTDDKRVGPEKDFLSWIQKKLTIFSMDDGEQKRMEKEHRYAVKTTVSLRKKS